MKLLGLSEDVRDLRVALGIGLTAAARLCRMSAVELGQIERGVTPIDVFRFVDLTRQLLTVHRRASRARAAYLRKKVQLVGGAA